MPPLRRPTLDENNRWFTAAVIGLGGVAGSAISFLYGGAFAFGLWRWATGSIALPRVRPVQLVAMALAAHVAAEALSTALHYRQPLDLYHGFIANLPFLGYLFIFARLSLTPRADVQRWIGYGAMAGGYASGLVALIQVFIRDIPRAEGMAGNPGPFALVCAVLFGFCVAVAAVEREQVRKIAFGAALFAAIGLILSGMRSLWPMLVVSPLLVAWLLGARPSRRPPRNALLAGLGVVIVVGLLGYGTVHTRVASMFEDVEQVSAGEYDNSLGQRLRVWSAAIELIGQSPVFGQGPPRASEAMRNAAHQSGERDITFSHAHNMALNALMRSGVLGLLAVAGMFLVPIWLAARAPKDGTGAFGFALLAILATTYLVNGVVNISFGHDIIDAFFLYCLIASTYLVFGEEGRPDRR